MSTRNTNDEGIKMHPYQLDLKITPIEGNTEPTPEPVSISGQLSDEDWELLKRFNERFIKLFETRFVQSGMQSKLNIKMEKGSLSFSSQLPDPDDFAAFLHRLRPLFLGTEETNFDKICELIKTRLANPIITSMISEQQALYHGERLQSGFIIRLTRQDTATSVSDEFIVNSDELLKKWLYSYEYHFDNNKRDLIESFNTIMPLDAQKCVFILLLREKMDAVYFVANFVRVILGIDKESTSLIRKEGLSGSFFTQT